MKRRAKLAHMVGMAVKFIGTKQVFLSDLYLTAVQRKTVRSLNDPKHPLLFEFQRLPSGQ